MRHYDDKSKNLNFDNYFLNVIFPKTLAYIGFKFCLHVLQTYLEGTVSQNLYLGPNFHFMTKIGKHFANFRKKTFSKSNKIETKA